MIDKLFKEQEITLRSVETVNHEFGKMALKLPKLSQKNIISQINDANQIIYFGCLKEKIEVEIDTHEAGKAQVKFNEGYAYSSLLKTERDRGVYFLKLKDSLNKEWEFKMVDDHLIGLKANFDLNFVAAEAV